MQKKIRNKEAHAKKLVIPANEHIAFPPPVINAQAQKKEVDVMRNDTDSEGDGTLDYSVIPFSPYS